MQQPVFKSMEELKCSAYRSFRVQAYRNKYEKALFFGGKSFTFGALLVRAEYAYNTFCQMGIRPAERVALWLPDCPDLLASFYGLSRLGAVGVLIHPICSPREVKNQMEAAGAHILITTAGCYERYSERIGDLPQSALILCRPELDMKGSEKRLYLEQERPEEKEERAFLDRMMVENTYNALETPAGDREELAVMLFGTSSFSTVTPITYLPEELEQTGELFWRHKEAVRSVYVGLSFATEGGFLAVHSALCAGKTVLWSVGDPLPLLKKKKPDFLVGTEEFFWTYRQTALSLGRWPNLKGGYQLGRELTPLMEKFASRVMAEQGGEGVLAPAPVPLKVRREPLCFIGDYGVRLADVEKELACLPGIRACRAVEEQGAIRLRMVPSGKESVGKLAKSIAACCRQEMNPRHLPKGVEFCTSV